MVEYVEEAGGFVKGGSLPVQGVPRTGRHDGPMDKNDLFRTNLPCHEHSAIRANIVFHHRIPAVVGKGIAGEQLHRTLAFRWRTGRF
ncbi:hypothetical protein SCARR_04270 [Pontiella sulfatireligans]|uniref:Uncharacterized protein n=1 Tax=Pontiella sulfatireligans TaxID=2750658 RepID=A0A6C2UPQ8_9BACT|nr:hypothetical protein SCARR_04270 [Pontiella sulfatireligans]